MILITGESDLKGTKWSTEDVINLQTRLTDEEFDEHISEAMPDMDRLRVCASVLNKRQALPARYKELVQEYTGSDKADTDIKIEM